MKLTPVLFVPAVEPTRDFFCERLGFTTTVTVPEGDRLGFAILNHGDVELMVQTKASLAQDMPSAANGIGSTFLFLEVPDFAAAERAVAGCEVVVPVRDTFYGMREIAVREPGGHVVCLACPIAK